MKFGAEQMCKGYLLSSAYGYVFGDNYGDWEALYEKVQSSDDFDGDGLKNGDEVYAVKESTGRPVAICTSDPTTPCLPVPLYHFFICLCSISSVQRIYWRIHFALVHELC